jgi:hypothetical protein
MSEAAYNGTRVNRESYLEQVEAIKTLNIEVNLRRWEIGDRVIVVCGPPGEHLTGLRQLAIDVAQSERYVSECRAVSHAFTENDRDYDVPWGTYRAAHGYGAATRNNIIIRYVERRRSEGAERPGRVNSKTLTKSVIREVLVGSSETERSTQNPDMELYAQRTERMLSRLRNDPKLKPLTDADKVPMVLRHALRASDEFCAEVRAVLGRSGGSKK